MGIAKQGRTKRHLLIEAAAANSRIATMKYNEADIMMIQRLKSREQSWKMARWAALFLGISMIGGSVFLFQRIWSTMAYDHILLAICVWVAPALGIVLFIGLGCVLYVFRFWNGPRINKLLLRLADEVEARESR